MAARYTKAEMGRVLAAARADPGPFIRQTLKIRAKNRQVVPFLFNEPQRRIHEITMRLRAARRPIRKICLKARQEGVSTQEAGYDFAFAASRPGTRSLVIAHERGQSQKLMTMRSLFVANVPAWMGIDATPTKNELSIHGFECADGFLAVDSHIFVETASGKEVGRGDTLHRVHLSEVAFYPDPERTFRGVLNAVPLEPDTEVTLESTANGVGDLFHGLWKRAEAGEGEFVPIFLPWFIMEEYRLEAPESFRPSDDEVDLAARHALDADQLYWRRQKIATDFGDDEEAFAQEFPSTPVEAFRVSGSPALPQRVLSEYREKAVPLTWADGDVRRSIFVPKHRGLVRVWEPPDPTHEYMIGVDTSLGVQGGDLSAAAVVDRTVARFVAEMLLLIDPRLFAHELRRLGAFFNMATIAIELNNHGLSTQNELVETLRYPKPWRWRRYDNLKNIWTDKLGWETNWRTRSLLIDNMVFGLRQRLVGIPSVRMIDQFLLLDAVNPKAGDDDLAMAGMIAWHCHVSTPMRNGRLPRTWVEPISAEAESPDLSGLDPMSRREWENVDRTMRQGRAAQHSQVAEVSDAASRAFREAVRGAYYDDDEDPAPEVIW